jgi:MFS family permease
LEIVCVFIARFSIAFYFSIFFLFVNELYPLRARGLGFGIGSAAGAVGTMSGNVVIGYFYENSINPQILNLLLAIIAISTLIFVP